MRYQIPGTLTKDGKPIVGGLDIDQQDFKFAAMVYPRPKKSLGAAKSPRAEKKAVMSAGHKKPSTRSTPRKGT